MSPRRQGAAFSRLGPLLSVALLSTLVGCSSRGGHGAGSHGAAGDRADPHAGHAAPPAAPGDRPSLPPAPSGYSSFRIDPAKLGPLGLSTARVERRALAKTLRTAGVVTLDETRIAHVHTKVSGFVEAVQADFVGKAVKAGSPLCSLFSQEVLAAQLELISLLKQRQGLGESKGAPVAGVERPLDAVVDAARRRLSVWDVPKGQIARLESTLEPSRTFALTSPRAGIVAARQAFVGAFVEPGTELFTISDLSTLWVLADVYEADVPYVTVGRRAKLSIAGVPEPLEAGVAFLPPRIDESTRTLKARFEVDNRSGRLKPGAFVTVELSLPMGEGLAVPEGAVIWTGVRNVVFVVHGEHVEPREVTVGPLVEGVYRVEAGLNEGESVATGAQFLLDSESRLRATSAPGGAHAGH